MTGQEDRPAGTPHPNPSPEGEGLLRHRTRQTTLLDWAQQIDSPPLQGRGRGWGLSAGRNAEIARHARTMRNNPTEPEKRLWSILRNRQMDGYKFRRQAMIAGAIADFLCPQKGLVIEVDGETHTDLAADAARTARLERMGYRVLRVTNAEVMQNLDGVWTRISTALDQLPEPTDPEGPRP